MEALEVKEAVEEELLKLPGVVGVGVGKGSPEQIIVYVEKEEHAKGVPKVLAGIPVKVIVTGKIRALTAVPGFIAGYFFSQAMKAAQQFFLKPVNRKTRVRPAPGGVSVSHLKVTAGTLGVVTYDWKILSNNHILAASNKGKPGDPIIQPGRVDGGKDPEDRIGYLENYVPLKPAGEGVNYVDAAVAKPLEPKEKFVSQEIVGVGKIVGWTDPVPNISCEKSGRTRGLAHSRIIDVHATVKVEGYPFGTAVFKDQVVFENPAYTVVAGGDSGSLLITRIGGLPVACGLVFAGSYAVGVANKIRYVVESLNINLGPYFPPPKPAPEFAPLAFIPVAFPLTGIAGKEFKVI